MTNKRASTWSPVPHSRQTGLTLVELLMAVVVAAILFSGIASLAFQSLDIHQNVASRAQLTRDARFAMLKIQAALAHSSHLILPQRDNPATNWPENLREETVPPSPPVGDSSYATAVLAMTLPAAFDLDGNGTADADDDADGRIDEDPSGDQSNDNKAGIALIDDDGDGDVDEGGKEDEDEDGQTNEDGQDGRDTDSDGRIDEDPRATLDHNSCSGRCGVDDDNDGGIDEGNLNDDDEDGLIDEDWQNPVVFYLDNGNLMQRLPVPWDIHGGSDIDGNDYLPLLLTGNVTHFRVERLSASEGGRDLIDLTLVLTDSHTGEAVSINTQVLPGSAL